MYPGSRRAHRIRISEGVQGCWGGCVYSISTCRIIFVFRCILMGGWDTSRIQANTHQNTSKYIKIHQNTSKYDRIHVWIGNGPIWDRKRPPTRRKVRPSCILIPSQRSTCRSIQPRLRRPSILRASLFLRDLVVKDVVRLVHLPGTSMIADILTKAVARALFLQLLALLAEYSESGVAHLLRAESREPS